MNRKEAKDYIREWCPYDRQEEIIKALEQEPCEDAISRQAVLDGVASIAKAKARSDEQKALMGRVMFFTEHLSSVNPQEPRWIPVSERLPEDGTWNIFTDGESISVERYKYDALDAFFPPGRWFQADEAVAWMPLPEPYKADKEIKHNG